MLPDTQANPLQDDLIDFADRLADAAGAVIRPYFRSDLTVEDKADSSPVTLADRGAESEMRRRITETYPDHGVFGEEFGADRPDAEFVWVLDPIDGTKRFITGSPMFGTLIALLHHGVPVLGVIDMPILGERWIGATGRPTRFFWRDWEGGQHSKEVASRACGALEKAVLSTTSPQMFDEAGFAAFERVRRRVRLPLYGGDCHSYGLVASGHADLVIEAELSPYDYLAIVPVIEGAGGVMTDWAGDPLTLESDGRVVAAGDGRAHALALDLLASDPARQAG